MVNHSFGVHGEQAGPQGLGISFGWSSMQAVTKAMKARAYRSIPNYLVALKEARISRRRQWTPLLGQTYRSCRAAGRRGVGRGRTSKSFTWARLAPAHRVRLPQLGMKLPVHCSSISSHLLFRAAEVGALIFVRRQDCSWSGW